MQEHEVDALVKNAIESLPSEYEVKKSHPNIKYSESIDLNHLTFLMLKIAYEISFYHHGSSVLADQASQKLRKAIYERNIKARGFNSLVQL